MYDKVGGELEQALSIVSAHAETYFRTGLVEGNDVLHGSTSYEDCALLYLLVKYFRRTHCFEIGTYIGTSAVAMNEGVRHGQGVVTTCDPVDYKSVPMWSNIRFIHQRSRIALAILQSEYISIDFCFMDWVPDPETMRLANEIFQKDTIIAVHDCHAGDNKGKVIVDVLNSQYTHIGEGEWFYPDDLRPVIAPNGMAINKWTAFFVPHNWLRSLPLA
jgi:predicted O-methyltransferase YrrM